MQEEIQGIEKLEEKKREKEDRKSKKGYRHRIERECMAVYACAVGCVLEGETYHCKRQRKSTTADTGRSRVYAGAIK
jgi:hypothetical protein